eukprot:1149890-Pelagomonas_calceolata.AAC.1
MSHLSHLRHNLAEGKKLRAASCWVCRSGDSVALSGAAPSSSALAAGIGAHGKGCFHSCCWTAKAAPLRCGMALNMTSQSLRLGDAGSSVGTPRASRWGRQRTTAEASKWVLVYTRAAGCVFSWRSGL